MCENRPCDLCGLDVGGKPYLLENAGKRLQFCCEGCLGVYQMLHDDELSGFPDETLLNQGERA